MIKTKEWINFTILLLVAAGALALYVGSRPHTQSIAPVFVYEEITAKPAAAARVAPASLAPRTISAPLPVVPPQIISQVIPEYPAPALEKEIEGVVLIQAQIDLSGHPNNVAVKTTSGNAELDGAAIKAISQWRFSPAAQGGAALSSVFEVPVRFAIK